jgi:thiamine-phosphate diphosphorylase
MAQPWPPSHTILCLVTDRRALAEALGGGREPLDALRDQVAAAVDAGVDLVHVRERDLEAGALRDLVGQLAQRASGSATRVVVNDRLDVALAAGAAGVHLRGDSFDVARARALAPRSLLVGCSVRDAAGAAAAADADYLVVGTVFPTPSKPGLDTMVGLDGLQRAVSAASAPVLAIGGVSEEQLPAVARTGAAGVAAIRLFFVDWVGGAVEWRRRVAAWRRSFDTNRPIS